MTSLPDIPLREALICLVSGPGPHDDKEHLFGALVRREGMRFTLIRPFLDDEAALLDDSRTIERLEGLLQLPVRVLDADNSLFLGMKTMLAEREGRVFFQLRAPKPTLGPVFSRPQGPQEPLRDNETSSLDLDDDVVRPNPLHLALNPNVEGPQ